MMNDPEMQELQRIYNALTHVQQKEFLKKEIERLKKELGDKAPEIDPVMQMLTMNGIKATDMSKKHE